jgi:predicted ABC-type ATPase
MAKRNYLVEGLSGAGKSSVYEELTRVTLACAVFRNVPEAPCMIRRLLDEFGATQPLRTRVEADIGEG